MSEPRLIHLHCHSEFSSLDGGSRVTEMAAKLKELGMDAMALTDHGVMQGLPLFYEELRREGIKPILGLEAYLTDDRHNRDRRNTPTWHLTLLAATDQGYKNLCKISSFAFVDGAVSLFGRYQARADWDLLAEYSEGIICLTGCMAAPVMSSIMGEGSLTKARGYTERLVAIFGADNVYGEIQNVGITTGVPGDSEVAKLLGKEPLNAAEAAKFEDVHGDFADEIKPGEVPISQTEANRILVEEICKPLGLKYVATGDVHYLNEDDALPHDAMLCVGTGQLQKQEPRKFSLLPKKYHMRSAAEMAAAIPDYPEALATTLEVADRCNVELEFGRELLPRFPLPEGFSDSASYLRHLCEEGAKSRYPEGNPHRDEVAARLGFELETIDKMGYNDYFLITWDLFREARDRNIPTGPGRGSAAGSIVAYLLEITQLCPLEYDLLFERFLNPDRISMPDIDMDFGVALNKDGIKKRDELMLYAQEKYNRLAGCETAVAQIVTFSKYKAKGALRDSARVLAEPSEDGRKDALRLGDRLAGLIPGDPSATMKSVWQGAQGADAAKQLQRAYKSGGMQAQIIKQAGWMEGLVRAYSIHAAAVLIADHDLTDDLPMQQFGAGKPLHVQYDMGYSEKIGLLKMDFLGLRNLDVIWDALEKIEHVHGVKLDPYAIPLDDETTYEMFARGETIGLFQFECLAGDTIINGSQRKTIADLYREQPRTLRSIDLKTGASRSNDVLAVVESGAKQLYRLICSGGYTLRASADHRILTVSGWKRLGELEAGDRIAVDPSDASRIGAGSGCSKQTRSRSGSCPACHDRAAERGATMAADQDHRQPATIAGGSSEAPVLPRHFGAAAVIRVEKDAVEMTYDIAMRAPHNNFIANGIVVHNSGGMQGALREVRPTEFRDLIALVALYRPGPMAHIPTYAARKQGREPVEYLHPKLEDIQADTYGLTVYQEQSMRIARDLAGFTPGEADDLRKAIGKKLRDKMDALKPKFMKGCAENGVAKEIADRIWADNEAAADYSFNLSHAACYAYLSYVTGYLKRHYPNEYMASLLSSVMGKKDTPRLYLTEAKRMGLQVLPPDINRSLRDFAVMERPDAPGEQDILFGLTALRGVGSAIVTDILAERKRGGAFADLYDLLRRMPGLSKSIVQALIKGGALDSTGAPRRVMFEAVEEAKDRIKKQKAAQIKAFSAGVYAALEAKPATGSQKAAANGNRKLETIEKRGLDAAALLAQEQERVPAEAALRGVIAAAVEKEQLRLARGAVRREAKEAGKDLRDGDVRGEIETGALAIVATQAGERDDLTERLLADARIGIGEHLAAADDEMTLAEALAEESDPPLRGEEWDEIEKLNLERQVLEVYVSGHPLERDAKKWAHFVDKGLGQIDDQLIGHELEVVGALVGKEAIKTRTGKKMFRLTFEDLTGSKEAIAWEEAIEGYEPLLEIGQVVSVRVRVEEDRFQQAKREQAAENSGEDGEAAVEDEVGKPVRLTISKVRRWDPTKITARPDPVTIEIPWELPPPILATTLQKLEQVCASHPGQHPVRIVYGERRKIAKWNGIEPTAELLAAVAAVIRSVESEVIPPVGAIGS